jgi:hypothetical protein
MHPSAAHSCISAVHSAHTRLLQQRAYVTPLVDSDCNKLSSDEVILGVRLLQLRPALPLVLAFMPMCGAYQQSAHPVGTVDK